LGKTRKNNSLYCWLSIYAQIAFSFSA